MGGCVSVALLYSTLWYKQVLIACCVLKVIICDWLCKNIPLVIKHNFYSTGLKHSQGIELGIPSYDVVQYFS